MVTVRQYRTGKAVDCAAMAGDPVGQEDIAKRLGVTPQAVKLWRMNERETLEPFPEVRWTISGRPAWDWGDDILPWLKRNKPGMVE